MHGAANGTTTSGVHFNNSNPGATCGQAVADHEIAHVVATLVAAYREEVATFTWGTLVEPKLLPGEVDTTVRICCDKDPFKAPPPKFSCDCNGAPF